MAEKLKVSRGAPSRRKSSNLSQLQQMQEIPEYAAAPIMGATTYAAAV